MLKNFIIQRISLCVEILLHCGLNYVNHVLIKLLTKPFYVMILYLLGIAQFHVTVSDRRVHSQVGGRNDGRNEFIPELYQLLLSFRVANDSGLRSSYVHIFPHLRDFHEALDVRDLPDVAHTLLQERRSLFAQGKVKLILDSWKKLR